MSEFVFYSIIGIIIGLSIFIIGLGIGFLISKEIYMKKMVNYMSTADQCIEELTKIIKNKEKETNDKL